MSFKYVISRNVCDGGGCHQSQRNMIEIYWASGNRHYCEQCWSRYRDYYESESGREVWARVGNYYAPKE
jgi:hypothetical protein